MQNHTNPQNSNDRKPQNAVVSILQGPKRENSYAMQTDQERKTMEKLLVLLRTFKPIPFKPAKDLNFTRHATLLHRLGLWDFVHVEFDSTFRGDLVAQLIASYAPNLGCGYVNGVRVLVNKAQFGRAMNLTGEVVVEKVLDGLDFVESIGFVEEFMWNWMVLNDDDDDDDACEVTNEVLGCEKLIKDGFLEKVDWLGLMWSMVEKELKAPRLVDCYYASHLNCLIKTQHEELMEEVVDKSSDVNIGVDDYNVELSLGLYNVEKLVVEKELIEGEQGMDCELNKEKPMHWFLDLKSGTEEQILRLCNITDVKGFDCVQNMDEDGEGGQTQEENGKKEGVHEGQIHAMEAMPFRSMIDLGDKDAEDEYVDHTMPKPISYEIDLSGNSSGEDLEEDKYEGYIIALEANPMPFISNIDLGGNSAVEEEHEGYNYAMEANQMPSSSMIYLSGNSVGDEDAEYTHEGYNYAKEAMSLPFSNGFGLSGSSAEDSIFCVDDPQMICGVSSLFGNGQKRKFGMDDHNSHLSTNESNKRLRSENQWNSEPVDFNMCMDHMQHSMGEARLIYQTEDQSCEGSRMNEQLLRDEIQNRDNMIEHLQKQKVVENQKIDRLEKELHMMSNLVESYRKVIRETEKAFADYRARCPQADEPFYKDVPGSGGLVLSVEELKNQCLEQEEEERMNSSVDDQVKL
ncbi:hypothetical protein Lal_00002983 [Lupinus albus]|uniref:Uncharacterized protein n=1 Tax=Lupinus albus TaxID=3870 RepID=A0A6A5NIP5_LUPAL|nr:hypothetical protein Lalb_Chr22g0356801 [Lupinus albus]KAF1882802.1 hypothetical protein Lal_00002983 [Lupinus albus]